MKKCFMMILAALGLMIGTGAFAQKPMQKVEEMAKMQADKLKSELMLNDMQTKQVYNQLVWNMQQKQENAQEVWTKTDAKMKEVLTPEQYAKWQKMQADKKEMKEKKWSEKEVHKDKM